MERPQFDCPVVSCRPSTVPRAEGQLKQLETLAGRRPARPAGDRHRNGRQVGSPRRPAWSAPLRSLQRATPYVLMPATRAGAVAPQALDRDVVTYLDDHLHGHCLGSRAIASRGVAEDSEMARCRGLRGEDRRWALDHRCRGACPGSPGHLQGRDRRPESIPTWNPTHWGHAVSGDPQIATSDWQVNGTYFEGCNCEAICPCRSIHERPGGPSTYGVCYGTVSWHVLRGQAGALDLSDRSVVLSLRYFDNVKPSTPWEVVLYVDHGADNAQPKPWRTSFSAARAGRSRISTVRPSARFSRYGPPGSPLSTAGRESAMRTSPCTWIPTT